MLPALMNWHGRRVRQGNVRLFAAIHKTYSCIYRPYSSRELLPTLTAGC